MNTSFVRWLVLAAVMALGLGASAARAQTNTAAQTAGEAEAEREACTRNLKAIYAAIEAYESDHKDLPNWLSDLVPQYLPDVNVLVCPVCRRTGQTEAPPLADPKIPGSYLFEFCPVPLPGARTNSPVRTRRDWKRGQMGLVGSMVPLVRCRHHSPVLNLSFDGRVYDSPPMWEMLVTNRVALEDLAPARFLAANEPAAKPAKPAAAPQFPARDPKASKRLLDLTGCYNAALAESWHGGSGNDLASLTPGVLSLGGQDFDVRGIVQLGSKSDSADHFPLQVLGIKVGQKCAHLHFLHAAGFGSDKDEGKEIGAYEVHFASQRMRLEIPIVYGRDVRNWHVLSGERPAPPELKVAWTGENTVSEKAGSMLRLFMTTWTNPAPSVQIDSLDYVSHMGNAAPFLLAITAD